MPAAFNDFVDQVEDHEDCTAGEKDSQHRQLREVVRAHPNQAKSDASRRELCNNLDDHQPLEESCTGSDIRIVRIGTLGVLVDMHVPSDAEQDMSSTHRIAQSLARTWGVCTL